MNYSRAWVIAALIFGSTTWIAFAYFALADGVPFLIALPIVTPGLVSIGLATRSEKWVRARPFILALNAIAAVVVSMSLLVAPSLNRFDDIVMTTPIWVYYAGVSAFGFVAIANFVALVLSLPKRGE